MTIKFNPEGLDTNHLLGVILLNCKDGDRTQFLVEPGAAEAVVQRLRVALSRSRARNKAAGRKLEEFTLKHSIYPYTAESGKRHSAIVMYIEKLKHHETREMLDDLMERSNVA